MARFELGLYRFGIIFFRLGRARRRYSTPVNADPLGGRSLSEGTQPASFSNVMLTLTSIIIALGIEHLLGHMTVQFPESHGTGRLVIAAQGVTTFVAIGAIWLAYATLLMTAPWPARFEDFFAPLLILALLYFWISAIGTNTPAWFYIGAVGWGVAFVGNRFSLAPNVAERLNPHSSIAQRSHAGSLGLCIVSAAGGAASQAGVLGPIGALVLISAFALVQMCSAWFHLQWWRAA